MSEPYAQLLDGATLVRRPPGERHELICGRLHQWVRAGVANLSSTVLLAPRSAVTLSPHTSLRPDLALIVAATGKLWLAAEIVSSDDHRLDRLKPWFLRSDAVGYAQQQAMVHVSRAKARLDLVPPSPARESLRQLADFVVTRQE